MVKSETNHGGDYYSSNFKDKGKGPMPANSDSDTGDVGLVAGFVSANVECTFLGAFRVPISFHKRFGHTMPSRLVIKCKTKTWTALYDREQHEIYGLCNFIRFYGIGIFSVVQFDYYGNGQFDVKIYREDAVECHYPLDDPEGFMYNHAASNYKEDKFIIKEESFEYENRLAHLSFNAFQHGPDYVEMRIISLYLNPNNTMMILNKDMERFYRHWPNGSKVIFKFVKRTWEVEIEWMAGKCLFQTGWLKFARESELAAGDTLILYKLTTDENMLNAVIVRGEEYASDRGEGSVTFPRSFYKVATQKALNAGTFIVPRVVNDKYYGKLNRVNRIDVGGAVHFVFYNAYIGSLKGLERMMKLFEVQIRETVFFEMEEESGIMNVRIYEEDGMEIDYLTRPIGFKKKVDGVWIFHIEWPDESESLEEEEDVPDEEEVVAEDIPVEDDVVDEIAQPEEEVVEAEVNNDQVHTFSATLSKCHVHNKTQGVNVPSFIHPVNRGWINKEAVLFRTEQGEWNIGLTVNNGRARFSAGWNKFSKENKLKKKNVLVFNMHEEADMIRFDITKHVN